MKIKFTFLLFLIISFTSFCQTEKFNDLIEAKSGKIYKFYLDTSFKVVKKDCSEFYLECKFNSDAFAFEDTLKIFNKNKKLYSVGNFSNGLKSGKFTWYHKNGKIAVEGQYNQDIREGIWKDYYENGSLHKVIEYRKESISLLEFFNKKGEQLVKEGNGHFSDEVNSFSTLSVKNKVEGNIIDGTLDGEWLSYIDNKLIGKEVFKNKTFVKGISYSVLGTQQYTDEFYSTFLDALPSENISFKSIRTKCDVVGMRINVNQNNNLNDILKKNYTSLVRNYLPKNYWFFAGLVFDGKDNLSDVMIYSSRDDIDKLKLSEFVKTSYVNSNKVNEFRDLRMLMPMAILNGELFLQKDMEIPLLSN